MTAYYNENDPRAAAWLRELIKAGHIAPGDVDERSIEDVNPKDLEGYTQCHFFAGIGGWSYALRLAGWSDAEPVWTGSCPCQPFSAAGKRKGTADERHLWPAFQWLIAQCLPPIVFGEQVASKAGREWLAGVCADMEGVGYAVGAADLCAAGVGAPHIRQRLYWVADAGHEQAGRASTSREEEIRRTFGHITGCSVAGRVGDNSRPRLEGEWGEYRPSGEGCSGFVGLAMQAGVPQWNGPTVALKCSDGPRRASAEPGAFPLAHGLPARMGRLRGYGNAIVPQVAAQFIAAYMDLTKTWPDQQSDQPAERATG